MGGLIDGGNMMLFLDMINGGNTTLLPLAGQWWEGTLAMRLVSSSLGWSAVWLVRCDGESAGAGGLIDGGNTMLFLGMINGGKKALLLAGADGLIYGKDTVLVLSAGRRFG